MSSDRPISYPFVPRSTANLLPGQFFSFRLSDGRFACGRILATCWPHSTGRRTLFYCGLMDWCGTSPASADDLSGCGLLYEDWFHVVIFEDYGSCVDGLRPLELDGLAPSPGDDSVSGRAILKNVAERHFVPRTV
ncbi:hypothetical protein [Aquisphaera insulae]|uniref:hypothetical protein n=1 Tax=Aquisphaera insulae TaxID=2712864 RepID=UPI0013ED6E12|nr:hypothetical protein [Aquisphaera insulae]